MRIRLLISTTGIIISLTVNAQRIPVKEMNTFFNDAFGRVSRRIPDNPSPCKSETEDRFHSGVNQAVQKMQWLTNHIPTRGNQGGDTLVIGFPPYDSLIITGDYTHFGPMLVIGNGILRFKHAHATIVGDVWVVGPNAMVTADSSYLYFPQEYFYQRSMVITVKGIAEYNNTTLDFSGLSHNLFIADSGSIRMNHIKDIGFTTCGLRGTASVDIENSNEPSEYVITDRARLTFRNDTTLLLWYQVPDSGTINLTFPPGDTLFSYHFNDTVPGISGIHYKVDVDTSHNVMWALMPSTGSHVSISDSKIRSVGLWFKGCDTLTVSGLVDNSDYSYYTADLPDRYLHFENTSVQTWSLYPMDSVVVNVTGCILGEIGTEGRSQVVANDIYVDGSGGYWWSADTTFMVGAFSTGVNAIRSNGQSIFIFAYSSLNSGDASSMGNSILMLVQSQLPDDPKLYDGSCIWSASIGKPSAAFVDTIVPIYGSAWIDKTPVSHLMGLTWYQLFYLHLGDTFWIPLQSRVTIGKHNEILGDWDTHGLSPGAYTLKLVLCDNTTDSNKVEAVKIINLLPKILGIQEKDQNPLIAKISPDPINKTSILTIETRFSGDLLFTIVDLSGRVVYKSGIKLSEGKNVIRIGDLDLVPGVYSCILNAGGFRNEVNFLSPN